MGKSQVSKTGTVGGVGVFWPLESHFLGGGFSVGLEAAHESTDILTTVCSPTALQSAPTDH